MTTPNPTTQTNPPPDEGASTLSVGDVLDLGEVAPEHAEPAPAAEPAKEPIPEPATKPAEPAPADTLRQREEQLKQREQEFAQRERTSQTQTRVMEYYETQRRTYFSQYAAEYERQGVDRELAQALAQSRADELAKRDAQLGWQQFQAKLNLERLIAREENVPIDILANHWDEKDMRLAAANYKRSGGPANEVVAALQKRVDELEAQLKKQAAPPTAYNQPSNTPGRPRVTTNNIDELYNRWDREHPNQPGNPYEERYRKIVLGG